jgi:hypothetical protein
MNEHSILVRLLDFYLSSRRLMLGGCLCLVGMVAIAAGAKAHDHNRPDLTPWFESLHSKEGAWCCNGDDADIVEWDMHDGHYRVNLDGEWVEVPQGAIVEGPNKVGGARVWLYYTNGRPNVRCFLPDSLT